MPRSIPAAQSGQTIMPVRFCARLAAEAFRIPGVDRSDGVKENGG